MRSAGCGRRDDFASRVRFSLSRGCCPAINNRNDQPGCCVTIFHRGAIYAGSFHCHTRSSRAGRACPCANSIEHSEAAHLCQGDVVGVGRGRYCGCHLCSPSRETEGGPDRGTGRGRKSSSGQSRLRRNELTERKESRGSQRCGESSGRFRGSGAERKRSRSRAVEEATGSACCCGAGSENSRGATEPQPKTSRALGDRTKSKQWLG